MTEQPYDKLTHDEILRVHGDAYSRMTPEQRLQAAAAAKERLLRHYAEQKELDSPRNKKLSEITAVQRARHELDELHIVPVRIVDVKTPVTIEHGLELVRDSYPAAAKVSPQLLGIGGLE